MLGLGLGVSPRGCVPMAMVGRGVEVGEAGEGLEPRWVGVPELKVQE